MSILTSEFKRKKKGAKILFFGSRWMNLHGRLLLGDPKVLLGIDKQGAWTAALPFYYLKADRYLPTDENLASQWKEDQLKATQVREVFRKHVALRAVLVTTVLCLGLGLVAARGTKGESPTATSLLSGLKDKLPKVGR